MKALLFTTHYFCVVDSDVYLNNTHTMDSLHFHRSSDNVNVLHCYVTPTLPIWFVQVDQ
jgi:hypothetical protein